MHHTFRPSGVCSVFMEFDIDDDGRLHNVVFKGGCDGNLKAIGKLVEGRDASETAAMLEGNTCGFKRTSCADQLAKAIMKAGF